MTSALERAITIAALLRAYEERLRRLPEEVDPGWLTGMGLESGHESDHESAHGLDLALSGAPTGIGRHLPDALGLPPATVAVAELAQPLHRISLLPRPVSARLLRLRALWRRRRLVRSLDPRLQRWCRDWVGAFAYETLLREGGEFDAGADAGLPLAPGGPEGVARALAWEGYRLLTRDGALHAPLPSRLLRLGFAPTASDDESDAPEPRAACWIAERLPRFVPEARWICD